MQALFLTTYFFSKYFRLLISLIRQEKDIFCNLEIVSRAYEPYYRAPGDPISKNYMRSGKIFFSTTIWDQRQVPRSICLEVIR